MKAVMKMNYSDWAAQNTGIFYQLNRVSPLPFVTDTATVENLDSNFLLQNGEKTLFTDDTEKMVKSIMAAYFDNWQKLTDFYKSLKNGVIYETTSTSSSDSTAKNQVALNDSADLFTTTGTNGTSAVNSNTQSKNYLAYKNFMLSSDFYGIINTELRNYMFINIY